MIGILTETIGSPDPISIPFVTSKAMGDSNLWWPIKPQADWHMRQSIEYSMTANRAILDYASRYREKVLYNIYRMGRDEIQWGSEDHWTFTPHEMARVQEGLVARGDDHRRARSRERRRRSRLPDAAAAAEETPAVAADSAAGRGGGRGESPLYAALTAPELRDPRGFVIPSDQPDFGTATKFVNTLMKTGITIHRATAPFTVGGKSVSGELVRREDRAGVPAARHGHVRAAGSSGRHSVPGRPADSARTMRPATRSRSRWACSSIASSTTSAVRSRS